MYRTIVSTYNRHNVIAIILDMSKVHTDRQMTMNLHPFLDLREQSESSPKKKKYINKFNICKSI